MPRRKDGKGSRKGRGKDRDEENRAGPRPFWSGTIAFGLVNVPVTLHVANRGRPVSLRMLDEDGTPLTRRYFCPEEDIELSRDEIVRGYEVEKGEFVLVEDDELEALEPEKSQEIDLRRFVALDEIDPIYFERAYFLLPEKGGSKAYRLLARAMEEAGRAGIATFVMRGKEYLVAILAQGGVLRAQTMRFADELRTPADVGLPELQEPDAKQVERLLADIEAKSSEELDTALLEDTFSRRLLSLAQAKLESGEGVLERPAAPEADDEEAGQTVVDLMRLLKENLQEVEARPDSSRRRRDDVGDELNERSKAELYEQAQELEIPGRSNMTKDELIRAIRGPR